VRRLGEVGINNAGFGRDGEGAIAWKIGGSGGRGEYGSRKRRSLHHHRRSKCADVWWGGFLARRQWWRWGDACLRARPRELCWCSWTQKESTRWRTCLTISSRANLRLSGFSGRVERSFCKVYGLYCQGCMGRGASVGGVKDCSAINRKRPARHTEPEGLARPAGQGTLLKSLRPVLSGVKHAAGSRCSTKIRPRRFCLLRLCGQCTPCSRRGAALVW
jgi:hypothetical protein